MRNKNIVKMAQIAMLMALVVVLQTVGTFVKVGAFNLSLVLIPIVIGGYLFGAKTGALLGGAFGVMALIYSISGSDAGGFMMWQANWWLTAIVCLVKGIAAGWVSGWISTTLAKKEKSFLGILLASIAAPVVNTGIFLVFLTTCYKETLISWAAGSGYGNSASALATYILMGIVLVNFAFELVTTTVLSPTTKRIIEAIRKTQR